MNLHIRFAAVEDFELVRGFDPHSEHIDPRKINSKLEQQEIILAFDEDKPVGLIKFSYFWSTKPYMDLIWVSEELRGQNIGSRMLAFLEDYLIANGYSYLYTSSQSDEDAPQKWHHSHGFVKCGVLTAMNLPDSDVGEVFFYKQLMR